MMNRVKLLSRILMSNNTKLISQRNICTASAVRSYKSHDSHEAGSHEAGWSYGPHEEWHDEGGYDLPIQMKNPYRVMLVFFVFCATGFWYPYFIVHYHRVRGLKAAGLLPKD